MVAMNRPSAGTNVFPKDPYRYQTGFGNRFSTEAIPGVLPDQNTPQNVKYDLYAECINGTAFVMPRAQNQSAWMYRIRPSVAHKSYEKIPVSPDLVSDFSLSNKEVTLGHPQVNWAPLPLPANGAKVDFIDGLKTMCGGGDPVTGEGLAMHIYTANASMEKKAFYNSDGDMLIIPSLGRLDIQTEFGKIMVKPSEFVVIQRGIKFKVSLPDGPSRGYVEEIFGSHFDLPELGIIGSNGLANARDFEIPVACFDIDESNWTVISKNCGQLFSYDQDHSPFDVVAWHGNYVPYKYDLEKFVYIGSLTKSHLDPSLMTVLTAKSSIPGVPLADFAVSGRRWEVFDGLRAPFYHRNCAVEMLGVVYGPKDSLAHLEPGGFYYQSSMVPHGQPFEVFKFSSEAKSEPEIVMEDTLILVFESNKQVNLTSFAVSRSQAFEGFPMERLAELKPQFLDHIQEINAEYKKLGQPALGATNMARA